MAIWKVPYGPNEAEADVRFRLDTPFGSADGTLGAKGMAKCTALQLRLVVAVMAAAPIGLHAQEAREMTTADFNRALALRSEADVSTTLTKLSDGRVSLKTRDGFVEVLTQRKDYSRFLNLEADVKVKGVNDLGFYITEVRPRPSPTWERLSLQQRAMFPEVNAAQDRLKATVTRAMTDGDSMANIQAAKEAANDLEESLHDAYANLPPEERRQQGRSLVDQGSELKQFKRDYFRTDYNERYPPQTYQRIFANTRGALALRLRGESQPQCSGVLVADNLVLTNRHCVSNVAASEMEVVFDYEDDLDGNRLPARAFPVSSIKFRGGEPYLDFSVLEIGPDTTGVLPGQVYPAQCIAKDTPKHKDAIYVVGFPLGQPRVVHDNTHVYFPFRISSDEYIKIEFSVREEFKPGAEEDQAYIDGKIKEFHDSYKQRIDGGNTIFEYYSKRFDEQPTIGVDSDTYPGNSGSPAFHRRTHALVGLLFDGHRTSSAPWRPGWRTHEAVLPVTKIIEAMEAQEPGWFSSQAICLR